MEHITQNEDKHPDQDIHIPVLEKYFCGILQEIYWAEQHFLNALPELIKAATTYELKDLIGDQLHVTRKQISRLEKVFNQVKRSAEGKRSAAIEVLVQQCKASIEPTREGSMTRDAIMITGLQKIKHYEIATYGGLVQLAIAMNLHKAADILDESLVEEEQCNGWITDVAEDHINIESDQENNYSWLTKSKPESSSEHSSPGNA